jgi:hypothetical protein
MHTFVSELRSQQTAAHRSPDPLVSSELSPPVGAILERQPTTTGTVGLGHDFSRIPVHANAGPETGARQNDDLRGEGDGYESDDREDVIKGALLGGLAGAAIGAAGGPAAALVAGAIGAIGGGVAGLLSCSASATGVSLGASGPINDGTVYGLRTPIIVRGTELADVLDSELVGASIDHTGSMVKRPSAKSSNSGFMAADKIPDDRHTSGIADHLSFFDGHGGDGSYSRLQMDLFKIPKCKIDTPQAMPNSGYRIKRSVKADGGKVVGVVIKTAEAVTIDGHKTTPGLTAKKEAKVTLRP